MENRLERLRSGLRRIDAISDATWLASLDERKRKELEFHDAHRDRSRAGHLDQDTYERFYGNKKYYVATELSKRYVDDWIRTHAPGKVFLDYACGDGSNALKAARSGALLSVGIDISRVSVENARRDAAEAGLAEKTLFVQADAENTMLPDASVDVVICSGMLHHLDLTHAYPELARILAPEGVILAVEALDYNPAIKLYRYLTPQMRTDWEKAHILSLKDVRAARTLFELGDIRYWHITSILGGKLPGLLPALNGLDRMLTRIPLVRLMAWIFTFELKKPQSTAASRQQ